MKARLYIWLLLLVFGCCGLACESSAEFPDGDIEQEATGGDPDTELDDLPPGDLDVEAFEEMADTEADAETTDGDVELEAESEMEADAIDVVEVDLVEPWPERIGYDELQYEGGYQAQNIPDPGELVSVIRVQGDLPVYTLSLRAIILHGFLPDLRIELQSPSGRRVLLREAGLAISGTQLDESWDLDAFMGDRTEGDWSLIITDLYAGDHGTLMFWELQFQSGPNWQPEDGDMEDVVEGDLDEESEIELDGDLEADVQATDFPYPIPDNDPAGLSAVISIAGQGAATVVCAAVDITHEYGADLLIELVSPSGTVATLKDVGAPKNAIDGRETYFSQDFVGEERSGNWTLWVRDLYEQDMGQLNSWTISATCGTPDPVDGDDDGSTAVTGGTCAQPTGLRGLPYRVDSNNLNVEALITPPASCTGWTMAGPERVWALNMIAEQTITIDVDPTNFDAGIYVLQPCDASGMCWGKDEGETGEPERLVFTAPENGKYYFVVDSASQEQVGRFNLWIREGDLSTPASYITDEHMPRVIPDNHPRGATSRIDVTESIEVENVAVRVDVTHPVPTDLEISFSSPAGTTVVLHNHESATGGIHRDWTLNQFEGELSTGEWSLRLLDTLAGGVGSLDNWRIAFVSQSAIADGDLDIDPDPEPEIDIDPDTSTNCPVDIFGNNNWDHDHAALLTLPVSYTNLTTCYNSQDWYKFNVTSGQRISANVHFDDDLGDIDLYLYREGSFSTALESSSGVSDNESIGYTVQQTDVYYLWVKLYTTNGQNSYSMNISLN